MTDPFGAPSGNTYFGSSAQGMPSSGSPDANVASQLGIPPQILAALRQRMAGMPASQHAAFLQQTLGTIPGIRERLMKMQTPLNPSVSAVAPPPTAAADSFGSVGQPQPLGGGGFAQPGGIGYGGQPMGQPFVDTGFNQPQLPDTGAQGTGTIPGGGAQTRGLGTTLPPVPDVRPRGGIGDPAQVGPQVPGAPPPIGTGEGSRGKPQQGVPGQNPNRFKGRLKKGKGLPPGQAGKAPGDWLARDAAMGAQIYGGAGTQDEKNAQRDAYFKQGTGRFNPQPQPQTVPNPGMQAGASVGGGGGAMNDYRLRRMTGQGRGTSY